MMISFKQRFVETIQRTKKKRITEQADYSKSEPSPEAFKVGQRSGGQAYYALAGRCVIRQENFGYILVASDTLFIVDELAISVLRLCDGFNSTREIKEAVREEMKATEHYSGDELESAIEQTLSSLAKNGITVWIPQSQVHLERRRE